MKITKKRLKQMIREELGSVQEMTQSPEDHGGDVGQRLRPGLSMILRQVEALYQVMELSKAPGWEDVRAAMFKMQEALGKRELPAGWTGGTPGIVP